MVSTNEGVAATAEENHAEALMRLIHQVVSSNSERATLELSLRQRLVLQCLGLGGEQSMAGIGQRLGLSPSTMTGLVDRIEALGHVKRRPHPSDRRVTLLALTRKGSTAYNREIDWYRSLVDEILGSLGQDAKQTVLQALGALHPSQTKSGEAAA